MDHYGIDYPRKKVARRTWRDSFNLDLDWIGWVMLIVNVPLGIIVVAGTIVGLIKFISG